MRFLRSRIDSRIRWNCSRETNTPSRAVSIVYSGSGWGPGPPSRLSIFAKTWCTNGKYGEKSVSAFATDL